MQFLMQLTLFLTPIRPSLSPIYAAFNHTVACLLQDMQAMDYDCSIDLQAEEVFWSLSLDPTVLIKDS